MHFGPNMTPMVDVVMVILIFFMSAAGFVLTEHSLASGLAGSSADGTEAIDDPLALPPAVWEVVLNAGADGGARFTGLGAQDAPLESLSNVAAETASRVGTANVHIALRVGASVAWDDVVRAHAVLRDVGITRIAMGGAD
jgi:biopolymer transport protein ExbD